MPILTASRRAVKLHPLATTHRPDRPFAEGLTIEPTPVNRVEGLLPTVQPEPVPAVPTWTEAEWKRAEYFHLRVPSGMSRPAPIVATPAPVPAPIVPNLDEVWHSGFCLGRAAVDAVPCHDWTAPAQLAFMDGLYWGAEQRAVDHEDDSDRYLDADESLRSCSSPMEVGMV